MISCTQYPEEPFLSSTDVASQYLETSIATSSSNPYNQNGQPSYLRAVDLSMYKLYGCFVHLHFITQKTIEILNRILDISNAFSSAPTALPQATR